jgi:hypothetical protein
MRHARVLILLSILSLLCGCSEMKERSPDLDYASDGGSAAPAAPAGIQPGSGASQAPAVERKIIRNAELTLELAAPAEGKRRIEMLAESAGGFVVSSEALSGDESGARVTIDMVVRIPASKFSSTLDQIRSLGYKIRREKVSGQDVTEEYTDLEARLHAKKAVEIQLLEIMRRAVRVADALEVEKALGDVRSEIEQFEGRRRLLDNQIALSTFTITLQAPTPLISVTGPGFFSSVKQAFGEGFDAALEVVLWLIRLALMLIPIVAVALPAVLLWRRSRRRKKLQVQPQA